MFSWDKRYYLKMRPVLLHAMWEGARGVATVESIFTVRNSWRLALAPSSTRVKWDGETKQSDVRSRTRSSLDAEPSTQLSRGTSAVVTRCGGRKGGSEHGNTQLASSWTARVDLFSVQNRLGFGRRNTSPSRFSVEEKGDFQP